MAFVKSRWFLTLIGIVLLCLIVWFAGPYFAFAEVKPLASVVGRLVAILVIVVAWALYWQVKAWRAMRATQALGGAAAAAPASAAASARPGTGGSGVGGADAQLRAKFDEAFAALRQSGKGAQTLLELPWYLIIGPPGVGKTTILENSGLEFPLEARFGKGAVGGVGGTRSCDWWFTSEAILLDTAGRYTTQDSDQAADHAGWIEFLSLLKKHRRRRPINGVLLAFSVTDLAAMGEEERERHVQAVRARLAELHQHLGVQLPVYVLLTKADLVAGFTEYFDDLDKRDRGQVWGATFPWDASRDGKAHDRLGAEFDELIARLAERVPDRLEAEREASRRAAIFAFPQQLAGLKVPLVSFVRAVFSSPTLDGRVWLRGAYLTSGTQEGTPIDRMLGALAKTFRLGLQPGAAVAGRGKAYFIEQLLREVVFREAGLAGSDRRAEWRAAALMTGVYVAIAALTVLLLVAMGVSYRANNAYVAQVAATVQPLAGVPSPGPSATLEQTVPVLDAVRQVVDTAAQYHAHVPWGMRFGLYQGDALGAVATDAYFRELNASFGPAVGRHLEARIRAAGAEPDKLYEYLKAYLMLAEPKKHLDPAQERLIAHAEWPRAFPRDPQTAERLSTHFDAYTAEPDRVRPLHVDAELVDQVRAALRSPELLPLLMYSRVRLGAAADTEHQIHLDKELGPVAAATMVRRSGKPLAEPFPALYTRTAFDRFNAKDKAELVLRFVEESWVVGEGSVPVSQSPRLAAAVVELYEQDYIRAWEALLADLAARRPRDGDVADAAALLTNLSSPTSPLKRLLLLTEANTNLLKPPPEGDLQAAAAAKLAAAAGGLESKVFGATNAVKPGTAVTEHFAAQNALVTGTPPPIDQFLALVGQAQQKLQAMVGLGAQPGSPAAVAAVAQAFAAVNSAATSMPPVVGGVVSGVAGQSTSIVMSAAHGELENRYQSEVVTPCRALVGHGYPIERASASDVTLADFAAVFGPAGLYDTFFSKNLVDYVDTSRSTWRWKDGAAAIGGSTAMLAQFQAVERIRQVFFRPGSATPQVGFTLTPEELDEDVDHFRLEVDGQPPLEYHHEKPATVSLTWPGGPVGHAQAVFELHDGRHPQAEFQGPWAWFRLLDQATVKPQSGTRFHVTFRSAGKQAQVVLEANSIRNPYASQDVAHFHCG